MRWCRYDLLVNGGGSVGLIFQRRPFVTQRKNVVVASNSFVVVDTVTLLTTDQQRQRDSGRQRVGRQCVRDHDNAVVVLSRAHLLSTLRTSCHTLSSVIAESHVRHLISLHACCCHEIPAHYRKSGSRNAMVTSDFRPELEIRPFRACAVKNTL